jgi:hypothetical protein
MNTGCFAGAEGDSGGGIGTTTAAFFFSGGAGEEGGYDLLVFFDAVEADFQLRATNLVIDKDDPGLAARKAAFPGSCVPIADGDQLCVEFRVEVLNPDGSPAPPEAKFSGGGFWEGYEMEVRWFYDTNDTHPNDANNLIQIIHANGVCHPDESPCGAGDDTYDNALPLADGYDPCAVETDEGCIDPGIDGFEDNFQLFLVNQTTIPEPGTMILVGSGVASLLYRRRRRNQRS